MKGTLEFAALVSIPFALFSSNSSTQKIALGFFVTSVVAYLILYYIDKKVQCSNKSQREGGDDV